MILKKFAKSHLCLLLRDKEVNRLWADRLIRRGVTQKWQRWQTSGTSSPPETQAWRTFVLFPLPETPSGWLDHIGEICSGLVLNIFTWSYSPISLPSFVYFDKKEMIGTRPILGYQKPLRISRFLGDNLFIILISGYIFHSWGVISLCPLYVILHFLSSLLPVVVCRIWYFSCLLILSLAWKKK